MPASLMDSVHSRSRPAVVVVMPAHNAAPTLPAQLGALAAQDFAGSWELVAVENASTDDTLAVLDGWKQRIPQLRVVSTPQPGASHARNFGVRASGAPLILLCDADDVVDANWISAMTDALDHHDLVAGPIELEQLNAITLPRPVLDAGDALPRRYGLPYAVTANIGFHRTLFDSIGGFDETITVCEDMDFGWRAHLGGLSLGTAPGATVHYRLRSTLRSYLRQQYRYAIGHAHVYAKHARNSSLPTLSLRVQTRVFAHDAVNQLQRLRRCTTARGRWEFLGRLAWMAGGLAGAIRYGVYP